MAGDQGLAFEDAGNSDKHPEVLTIEDVITFRLQRLVAIGERAGHDWSQRLFDLSLNEWRVLALVQGRAPARAGGLADILLMDKSQTSRVIKSLLDKELIRSFPDANDGRAIALEPTSRGEALYHKVFSEVMRSNERILKALNEEEVEALDRILSKLTSHSIDLLDSRFGRRFTR